MKKQIVMLALMVGGISQLSAEKYEFPVHSSSDSRILIGRLTINGNFQENGICEGCSWAPDRPATTGKLSCMCRNQSGVMTSVAVFIADTDNAYINVDGYGNLVNHGNK